MNIDEQTLQAFEKNYRESCSPQLPTQLSGYQFVSCLQDEPRRKIWLLRTPTGLKNVICKYASGEYVSMLRTEKNISGYEKTYGKFSFIPYIIDYFETENGEAYLLREYIEGETLQELIEKKGPMAKAQALPIIRQLCDCLSRLHRMDPPIIYRDLKPANVVVTPDRQCYLIDIGTIRLFHAGSSQDTTLLGTAATAAPEQFGARQTDERTDVYALGKLYAYLLTAELEPAEHLKSELPLPDAKIIKKATAFDPDNRYSGVEEFYTALTRSTPFPGKKRYVTAIAALSAALVCTLCLLAAPLLPIRPKEVVFDSLLMRNAVCAALGKAEGEPVYYYELEQIQSLGVCGEEIFTDFGSHYADPYRHTADGNLDSGESVESFGDIQDISLLAHMTNLNELVLDYQNIRDLSPLKGLPLSRVSLCGNPFHDLTPLKDCDSLRVLYLAETNISDLSPLGACNLINELNISRTKVTEIFPVSALPVSLLTIADLELADYDRLQEMPIEQLICRHISSDAFDALSRIPSLNHIVLYESGITSLSEVAMFHQVSTLDVCSNHITDLGGIENFPDITCLCMLDNPLTDISGVGDAEKLSHLQLGNAAIRDFSPLAKAKQLQLLTGIPENQLEDLYKVIPQPWFQIY